MPRPPRILPSAPISPSHWVSCTFPVAYRSLVRRCSTSQQQIGRRQDDEPCGRDGGCRALKPVSTVTSSRCSRLGQAGVDCTRTSDFAIVGPIHDCAQEGRAAVARDAATSSPQLSRRMTGASPSRRSGRPPSAVRVERSRARATAAFAIMPPGASESRRPFTFSSEGRAHGRRRSEVHVDVSDAEYQRP